jgi:hypothetical protein
MIGAAVPLFRFAFSTVDAVILATDYILLPGNGLILFKSW